MLIIQCSGPKSHLSQQPPTPPPCHGCSKLALLSQSNGLVPSQQCVRDPFQLCNCSSGGEGGSKNEWRTSAFLLSSVRIASSAPNPFLFLLAPNIARKALFIVLCIFLQVSALSRVLSPALFLQRQCQFAFVLGRGGASSRSAPAKTTK